MLWLVIHLAQLPLEVFENPDKKPLAITENLKQRSVITYCNAAAQSKGVENHINRTLAQSLCPEIDLQERNKSLEKQTLNKIACWAYNYTPHIYFLPESEPGTSDRIFFEISKSLKLFKGLDNFLLCFKQELDEFNFYYQTGLAGNPALANLASTVQDNTISKSAVPTSRIENRIIHLHDIPDMPVQNMQRNEKITQQLISTGIKTLGDLLHIDHQLTAKQFGQELLEYLLEIKGKKNKTLLEFSLPDQFTDELNFISEIENSQQLLFPIQKSISHLANYLHSRQLSLKTILITLLTRDGHSKTIKIRFSQKEHHVKNILKIIRLKFDTLELQDSVIKVIISCCKFYSRDLASYSLFNDAESLNKESDIDKQLVDSIYARLGKSSVFKLSAYDDHRPELAFKHQEIFDNKSITFDKSIFSFKKRPVWILKEVRPLHIKHRKIFYFGALQLLSDAERIETGWWDKNFIKRDYFIAQHPKGEYYWIYKDYLQNGQWFLQGIFS